MAANSAAEITPLQSTTVISIAELSPLLSSPGSKSIKAIVSVTWPYSSITLSIAFLLVEPDFRLRRRNGQVRVQFSGSSAKAVSQSGIASGDEVLLSLNGVEWLDHEAELSTPGKGVAYELKFQERLYLQFQRQDSEIYRLIDISCPSTEPELQSSTQTQGMTSDIAPNPQITVVEHTTEIPANEPAVVHNQWPSPAFIKRARTSYGSLFDNEYDPFDDEGTVHGKGRKRFKSSSSWTFQSRSPSPNVKELAIHHIIRDPTPPLKPMMLDEACQTVGLEDGIPTETVGSLTDTASNALELSEVDQPVSPRLGAKEDIHEELSPKHVGSLTNLVKHSDENMIIALDMPHHGQPIGVESISIIPEIMSSDYAAPLPAIANSYHRESAARMEKQVDSLTETPEPTAVAGDHDDLYSASPVRPSNTSLVNGFDTTEKSPCHISLIDPTQLEGRYGVWQDANSHTSAAASPSKFAVSSARYEAHKEDGSEHGHYADNHGHYAGLRMPPDSVEIAKLTSQGANGHSEHSAAVLKRPSWPGNSEGQEFDEIASNLPFGDSVMSRSQTAQSPTVDLMENNHDEHNQSEYDESSGDEDEALDDIDSLRGENVVEFWDQRQEQDVSDGYESERGADTPGSPSLLHCPPNSLRHTGQTYAYDDETDDAELYKSDDALDDDESTNSPAPQATHLPVVIDLLSSDDEDHAPDHATVPKSTHAFRTEIDDGQPESEASEESMDSEYDRRYWRTRNPAASEAHTVHARFSAPRTVKFSYSNLGDEDGGDESPVESLIANLSSPVNDDSVHSNIPHGGGDTYGVGTRIQHKSHPINDNAEDYDPKEESENTPRKQYTSFSTENIPHQTPRRSLRYNSQFSLDGADDDQNQPVLSPGLLTEEISEKSPAILDITKQIHTAITEEHVLYETRQLPTPDMTQISEFMPIDSQICSLDSVASLHVESSHLQASGVTNKDSIRDHTAHSNGPPVHEPESAKSLEVKDADRGISHTFPSVVTNDELMSEDDKYNALAGVDESTDGVAAGGGPRNKDSELSLGTYAAVEKVKLQSNHKRIGEVQLPVLEIPAITSARDLQAAGDTLNANKEVFTDSVKGLLSETMEIDIREELLHTAVDGLPIQPHDTRISDTMEEETKAENNHEDEEVLEGIIAPRLSTTLNNDEADDGPNQLENTQRVGRVWINSVEKQQLIAPAPGNIPPSPRRSQRIEKSASLVEVQIPAREVTPSTPEKNKAAASAELEPLLILDTMFTPEGYDASAELAFDSIGSPSKQPREAGTFPALDIKLRLSRCLRTELRQFTSLKVLRYHLGKRLDVLAIATTTPAEAERAKSGPRHYAVTFNITDPSIAPSGVAQVQIFRPFKAALPKLKDGDGILLRSFEVVSIKNRGFGLRSEDPSSWAVFIDDGGVDARGPPVELEGSEKGYVSDMKAWYKGIDTTAHARLQRANAFKETFGVPGKGIGSVARHLK